MNAILLSLLCVSIVSAAVISPFKLVKVPTCTEAMSDGACSDRDNSCKTAGYMCDTTTSLCCPMVEYDNDDNIAGPALGGKCEDFFTPVVIQGSDSSPECVALASLPADVQCPKDRQGAACSPSNTVCAAGSTCYPVAGVCCKDV